MGKSVICSRSAGVADLLRDGQSVIVVPPEDSHALRAAIAKLDMDSALWARLGGRKLSANVDLDRVGVNPCRASTFCGKVL
jgi:glycosyltransferase involved in cell wall biosynthesis